MFNLYTLDAGNGDLIFDHSSSMYPQNLEKKINKIAKEEITKPAPPVFGNFINTFVIKKSKIDFFIKNVLPNIGFKITEKGEWLAWDKDEEVEANLI